jgi:hypothetical protein
VSIAPLWARELIVERFEEAGIVEKVALIVNMNIELHKFFGVQCVP